MFRTSLALAASFLLTACGGGGGTGPFANHHQVDLPADGNRSGYVRSDGSVFKATGALPVRLGDYSDDRYCMGFYSFAINGINPDAIVTQAWLVVGQENTYEDPYTELGGLVTVDHVAIGADLNGVDINLPNHITPAIGTLSVNDIQEQKFIDVTAAVQADLDALRTKSEFRLRFPIAFSSDGNSDRTYFNTPGDAGGSGFVPRLIIEYAD